MANSGSLALLWSSGFGAWPLLAATVAAVGYSAVLGTDAVAFLFACSTVLVSGVGCNDLNLRHSIVRLFVDQERYSASHQKISDMERAELQSNSLGIRPLHPSCIPRRLITGINMIFLTRKAEFSSAHFYWNDAWSPEENQRVFGRCANRNGHGHNYTLEVTVCGEVDPISGFVVDLKELKDILEREVIDVYDHHHLNLEVPEFKTAIPTTENIAIAIWQRLDNKIPYAKLYRIRVYEMPDLFADYYGEL